MDKELEIPLFPLHTVLFPGAPLPLQVVEPRYKELVADCLKDELPFGVVLIKEGQETAESVIPHMVGSTARIASLNRLPDGLLLLHAVGEERFHLIRTHRRRQYLTAQVRLWPDDDDQVKPQGVRTVAHLFRRFLELQHGEGDGELPDLPRDPGLLANLVAAAMPWAPAVKQELLEALGPAGRLERVIPLLRRDVTVLRWLKEHANEGKQHDLNLN